MHKSIFVALGLFVFLTSFACADANQSFYQIVDPDGRIRTISVPVEKNVKGSSAPVEKESIKPEVQSEKQEPASLKTMQKPAHAPYDSDTYLDSDILESTDFNPERKKNFYIIPDGSGTRFEQGQGASSDVVTVPEQATALRREASLLPDELVQVDSPEAIKALLGKSQCMSSDEMKKARGLVVGRTESLYLDKHLLGFVGLNGVAEAYHVGGDGLREISVKSYANSTRSPAYAMPYLVLSGKAGCASRVLSGYFQKQYPATKSQHAMISAEITMHSEEIYVVVVMPDVSSQSGPRAYRLSQYGQLGIKWKP